MLRNRPFVALCAARSISLVGDQVAAIALVLLIARDHPAKAVGGLLLAESLPMLLSTHAGVIADRFEARGLMIACQLGQGVIFAVITVWLPPYAALLAFLVVAALLGTVLRAATQRGVTALVPEHDRMAANAMLGTALWAGVMLGPAIGGALAGIAGARAALAVDTVTFALSAATLLILPLLPRAPRDEADTGGVVAAFRFAAGDPILRSLMLGMAMLVSCAGIDNVGLVFLVRDTLDGGSTAYGVAMAIFGVGMVTGSAAIVRFSNWRAEGLLVGTFILTAASTLLLGLAPTLAVVYIAQGFNGLANGVDVAAQTTLVQQRTPAAMLGRMSGAVNTAVAVGFLVAYLGGGALVDATSPRTAFLIAGVGTFLAVALLKPMWRPAATPST